MPGHASCVAGGMAKILAATFQTKRKADAAVRALVATGVPRHSITVFHNNAPGQHAEFPVGGDEHADPVAKGTEKRTLGGAAAGAGVGAVVGAVAGGPLGAAAGAGVGALAGALGGTYTGLAERAEKMPDEPPLRRPAGTVVAVNREAVPVDGAQIIQALSARGTVAVEEADGEWRDAKWTDFDPLVEPRFVSYAVARPRTRRARKAPGEAA